MIENHISKYAKVAPQRIAFVIKGEEYSYQQLDRDIDHAAYVLSLVYHVGEKERVVLRATRSYGFLCCYFALHRINAIALPVDEDIADKAFAYIVETTTPLLIIGNKEKDHVDSSAILEEASDGEWKMPNSPALDSVADIMFTSGTTGSPKGVMLTHKNILTSASNMAAFIGNDEGDVEVLALPLCHSFGLGRIRSTMLKGGTIYLHDGFSNVKSLFKLIDSSHATGFSMVPAGWRLIQRLSGSRISRFADQLKYIEMGSSYLSIEEKEQLAELLPNTRICMHYGLTEASRSAFLEFHGNHLDSVGRVLPGVDVKICTDGQFMVEEGAEGEICIAGDHVAKAYWQIEKDADNNDYLKTGDLGYIRDGFLYISGRLKDIINVGGKKVSATEIEALANTYSSVRECACVAKNDSVLGEVPVLYVVVEDGFEQVDLTYYLKANLEEYKLPHAIEIIDELPKTHNGKVQKYKLM